VSRDSIEAGGSAPGTQADGAAPALPFDPIAEAHRQWVAHGWGDAAEGMAVVTSIMRAQQLLLGRADAILAPFGLTFARFEVLRLLAFTRAGALPLGKIGSRLQVHATSVTNAVDRLEAQGYVRRDPHPSDGRAVLAAITDSGRAVVEEATGVLNGELFAELGLDARAMGALFATLETLRRAAGDFA
jgi:DNA-binding MarR family transcriptional regulator